jgi:hypothetical protein
MSELLSRIPSRDLLPILFLGTAILAGGIVAIACMLTVAWSRHRARELNASIIESMLAQGLSADEIERVLKAADLSIEPRHHGLSDSTKAELERTSARTPRGVT